MRAMSEVFGPVACDLVAFDPAVERRAGPAGTAVPTLRRDRTLHNRVLCAEGRSGLALEAGS